MEVGDTGFDTFEEVKAETNFDPGLYASLYAHDSRFAVLIRCWSQLSDDDRQELADLAERLVATREQ